MNKKNNRKGFTIVELVIVIAVIAILATVLVPTFGSVISDAQATKKVQGVKNAYTAYTVANAKLPGYSDSVVIKYEDAYYQVTKGAVVVNNELVTTTVEDCEAYWDAAAGAMTHNHGNWDATSNKCGFDGCNETEPTT